MSSREQADRCEVTGPPNIVLTCDEPTRERRFTIKFQEFSPNLWGHEFKSMHDYYIIGKSEECGGSVVLLGRGAGVVMIARLISDCA